ncbi:MAG: glycosyltransferase family 2 protein [Planctomycetota bacterium]|jgi:glycosyltransferase involved in cell wall biosynthesis
MRGELRVSVVIPTYNRARLVCEAIDSVLAQTFPGFELLLVDDGSTDGTAEVIRSRYGDEPRLRYLAQENGGTAKARDHGLRHARGELVALLDSDDLWLPRHLESQVACLDAQADVDLVICDARYEGGERTGTIFGETSYRLPDSVEALAKAAWALPGTMLMRADAARTLGFRSEFPYAEDTDFLWRLVLAGHRVRANPEVLTVYRHHDGAGEATQKSLDWEQFQLDQARLMEHYLPAAGHPRDMICAIHRRRAAVCVRRGEWGRARSHFWNWWRRKPDSSKALRGLIRSLFR